ncbi:enoyl-CoA hydratase [Tumebacillus sp. ITR2]|uniref:Enoyl-CoA hydratase n=1 Tax=Tumebacillus amylolyticus TaxID=2801339 RepID=A0ABS1JCP9_9BACL|nr:enoyl-CoA hydratase [Tumebacillus amylolyticus]MBL0388023.1 enoyl-CoA hydratase [Tumebacillus amylolyticus]
MPFDPKIQNFRDTPLSEERKGLVVTTIEDGIATVTLNRVEAHNALSVEMLEQFIDTLYALKFDPNVRVVVVTGAGEKSFCAGADLIQRGQMDMPQTRQHINLIRTAVNELDLMPQPVIAAVNGVAFGGGMELALPADIRIATPNAKFGLTEVALAIIPGAGGTQRLPRLIGLAKAKELILTARRIEATEAERIGLVNYVVPHEELLNKAYELAREITKNGPMAVRQAKLAINKGVEVDLATGLSIEQNAYEVILPSQDRVEGLRAFKEKRPPVYKGE